MTLTTIGTEVPIRGAVYDHSRPETREPWMRQRQGGITATEIRDWHNASRRREIIDFKVSGTWKDLSHIPAVDHGNRREPIIAEWIERRFGIAPCGAVYMSARNPRHLASPDGISLDPFTGELIVGTEDAVISEIKTSYKDLTPGRLDAARVLVAIDPDSAFDRTGYYVQMQWQMYVMNAHRTLFVYERHTGEVDPETGTFTPDGPPEYAWIPRDQKLIDALVLEVAPRALEEIDAARTTLVPGALPPVSEGLDSETSALIAELLAARDAVAVAEKRRAEAWEKLEAHYLGEGKSDVQIKIPDFATITVSTSTKQKKVVDEEGMRKRAPKAVETYEKLRERFTTYQPDTTQRLTITGAKTKETR